MYDRLEGRVKNSLTRVLIDHIKSSRSVPSHTEVTQVHPKISPVRVVSRAQRNCFQLHSVFCLYPALPEYQIHDFLFFFVAQTQLWYLKDCSQISQKKASDTATEIGRKSVVAQKEMCWIALSACVCLKKKQRNKKNDPDSSDVVCRIKKSFKGRSQLQQIWAQPFKEWLLLFHL